MLKDKNGNEIAFFYGGPLDGSKLSSGWANTGSTYTPAKTMVNRPEYVFFEGKWIFRRYLPPGE